MNTMTPAMLIAMLEGQPDSSPEGIIAQEIAGQKDLARFQKFPVDVRDMSRPELEALGFVFGEGSTGDELFQDVKLPPGWRIEPTDHSMWSTILDETGAKRGSIFYKAAWYDQCAFANMIP